MPSPRASKWHATPNSRRHRKRYTITLSDEAAAKLDRMAGDGGVRSAIVEALILAATEPGDEEKQCSYCYGTGRVE